MNIGIDNVAAMYELTEMLIQRGYQNRATMRQSGAVDFSATSARLVQSDASPPYVINRVINAALPPNFFLPARRNCGVFAVLLAGTGRAGMRIG